MCDSGVAGYPVTLLVNVYDAQSVLHRKVCFVALRPKSTAMVMKGGYQSNLRNS